MEHHDEVSQILHQLGVGFRTLRASDDFAVFEMPDFGARVIWSIEGYNEENEDWNILVVYPQHDVRVVRENIIWLLARGGFFHYLRSEYPNTFKQMLAGRSGEDWHKKIIKNRLAFFGDKPKYKYFKELNKAYLQEPSTVIGSLDPGFYDIIY